MSDCPPGRHVNFSAVSAQSPFIHFMSYLADNQKTPDIKENQPESKTSHSRSKMATSHMSDDIKSGLTHKEMSRL